MRVLLVEDDEHKRERVEGFLRAAAAGIQFEAVGSVQSALRALGHSTHDAVILDMSLPVFDYSAGEHGYQHLSFGGRDVLDFLDRQRLRTPVVVLTALDRFGAEGSEDALTLEALDEQLQAEYPDIYLGAVWYSALEDGWQTGLLSLLVPKITRTPKS